MKKLLLLGISAIALSTPFASYAEDTAAEKPATAAEEKAPAGEAKGKVMMGRESDMRHGDKMFESADTNTDGFVTKEEFIAASEKRFAEMDTDGDGKIAKTEVEARRAEWVKKMKELREKRRAEKAKLRSEESAKDKTDAPATSDTPADKPAGKAEE